MGKIERHIDNLYVNINTICKRLNLLEVKNDSDKLHEKINKEYLKVDIGVTSKQAMDNMDEALRDHGILLTKDKDSSEWINLDIDNLPERFFTRDDIEIEYQFPSSKKWEKEINKLEAKQYIPHYIIKDRAIYRYRIIQEKKEPIMYIRKSDMEVLSMYYFNRKLALIDFAKAINREVEIID